MENKGRRYQTFVANRVSAISEQSSPIQWKYVETNLNPTDDASRGLTVDAIVGSNRWCMGPCFLWQTEESWPQRPAAMYEDREEELRTSEENTTTFLSVAHPANQVINKLFERFSLRFQLKKCVAWMLWFKDCWRNAVAKWKRGEVIQPCSEKKLSPLDVKEMEAAEKAIIRAVQGLGFYEELLSLRTVQREVKKSSSIVKLDPVFVEGIICVGGRLHNSPIKKEAKHPVILLKDHHVSEPIMHHYHLISGNSGLEHTPSLIRQKYWIIQVRIPLCHILNSCFDCRRRQATVGQQKMANLPDNRVTPSEPPFSYVGVDCFGPLDVCWGRSTVKWYGVLFTCLSIWTIHTEVTHSLDTDSFIDALRRCIAWRGQTLLMRSDNVGNFVKAKRELCEAVCDWNQSKIHDFPLARNIKWIFNPPAPYHGGVWEWCIRSVQKVMKALTKEEPLDDKGLLTLICEVEVIINGWSTNKVSDDPSDPEALTPNHLLLLRSGPTLSPGWFSKEDNYPSCRWKQVQHLANVYWRCWIREYLPTLRERRKRSQCTKELQCQQHRPSARWTCPTQVLAAGVLEVYRNRGDGLVRSVKVKTRSSVLVQPIDKIVLLEAAWTRLTVL